MAIKGKRPGSNIKNVPYLSHEFVIQNHGDIATCICMVFVIGFMFQATSPLASSFIVPQYNVTDLHSSEPPLYSYGPKDALLIFFYTICVVVFHAIIQEYVLDKYIRKVRLSKTKSNKFNESGHMLAFYFISVVWGFSIFKNEGYGSAIDFFWTGYPHIGLTFSTKFFLIIQMSYWIHVFPELYLQKTKREDIMAKILFASIHFAICAGIYVLNMSRIGITILLIDYVTNFIFHLSRILYFSGKTKLAKISFNIYNFVFVVTRLKIIVMSIFIFWFGFAKNSVDSIDWQEGNFNTKTVRLACLGITLTLQAWMLWNFILFQCKRIRENTRPTSSRTTSRRTPKKNKNNTVSESADSDGTATEMSFEDDVKQNKKIK